MVEKVKVYRNISEVGFIENAVVTTGTFDGVHLGHQKIIHRLNEVAESVSGQSVVFTFTENGTYPDDYSFATASTLERKNGGCSRKRAFNDNHSPFRYGLSKLSSIEFSKEMFGKQIKSKKTGCGYNHQFSRNREGTYKHFKEV